MTIINQKSISGITSITTAAAGDNLLTVHTNNGTERLRIDSSGNTRITAGIVTTLTVTGNGTVGGTLGVTGDVDIADKIVHTGDTNTAIRFPAADTITAETGGTERLRINSTGQTIVGDSVVQLSTSSERPFQVHSVNGPKIAIGRNDTSITSGNTIGGLEFYGNDANGTFVNTAAIIVNADGTHGDDDKPTRMQFYTTADGGSSSTERLRITSDGNVSLVADNQKLLLGAGDDLEIYHDGSHSYIKNGTGNLYLQHGGENMAQFTSDGNVELYHDNSKKFETTSTGITVTGNVAVTSGNGIDFSATGDGTGSNQDELLDDYETGNWTPLITSGASDVVTYTGGDQDFRYIKVGRLVTLFFSMNNVTTAGNTGGTFLIGGMPFAADAGNSNNRFISGDVMFYNTGLTMSGWPVWAHHASGDTTINFYEKASAGAQYGSVTVNSVGGGTYFFFSLQYYTA